MQKQTPALFVKGWPKIQKTEKPKKVISGAELQYLVDIISNVQRDLRKMKHHYKQLSKVQALLKGMR